MFANGAVVVALVAVFKLVKIFFALFKFVVTALLVLFSVLLFFKLTDGVVVVAVVLLTFNFDGVGPAAAAAAAAVVVVNLVDGVVVAVRLAGNEILEIFETSDMMLVLLDTAVKPSRDL